MTTYVYPSIIPTESTVELLSNTATFVSPITGATQTLDRGGERWRISLVHRNLRTAQRGELMGFLAKLNGQQHRVTLYNHAENNRGAFGGTPLVAGGSQTGNSLNIDGCSLTITNWIRAGDWFSVSDELKLCTADANSDGSGLATISFVPRIRTAPANDDPLTTTAGTGTFILDSNSVSWSNKPGGFSDFSVSFVEDIT